MIEKGRVISLISSAAGLLLAVGSMTVFSACGPKEDGTLMICHNAQIRVAMCGMIAAFVKSKAIKLICDTAALVLSVVTFMTPGVLVQICHLSNIHCQVRLKPFTRGAALFIALLAVWDILRIIKEKREKGPGEEE